MEFGEEYLMFPEKELKQLRKNEEKEPYMEKRERKEHAEAKDETELTHIDIKITIPSIGLEVIVNASDPLDCVTLAGQIVALLRESESIRMQGWGKEPKVVILP